MNESDTPLILVINAGSTSRQFALFRGGERVAFEDVLTEENSEAIAREGERFVREHGFALTDLQAIIGRGGILRAIRGGVYAVNEPLLRDCTEHRFGRHTSNLVAPAVKRLAEGTSAPALIANPPTVDELCPEARLTGHPEISRRSVFHALNQKAVARELASSLGKSYAEARLIVVHMGGGLSVGAHRDGEVVDVNDALEGDGPFAMNRAGGLPALPLVRWAREKSLQDVTRMICKSGGFVAHLGTDDAREVERRMVQGDAEALKVFEAFTYQIAKAVAAMTIPLEGRIDAIALTGGLARWTRLVERLKERLGWLAPVHVYPGSREMEALASAALGVLRGEESVREY